MKSQMTRRGRVIFIATTFFLSGCEINASGDAPKPTPLIANLVSYSSRADVEKKMPEGTRTTVIADAGLKKGDARPPFSILKLRVNGFAYCDQVGDLELEFFNDRLHRAWYFPKDVQACIKRMGSAFIDKGNTKIEVRQHDFTKQFYLLWWDKRLSDEEHKWIERYSWRYRNGIGGRLS